MNPNQLSETNLIFINKKRKIISEKRIYRKNCLEKCLLGRNIVPVQILGKSGEKCCREKRHLGKKIFPPLRSRLVVVWQNNSYMEFFLPAIGYLFELQSKSKKLVSMAYSDLSLFS